MLIAILLLTFTSCGKDPGTKECLSTSNESIEVYKYWLTDGNYVYISRLKNQPNVVTTTWRENQGKTKVTKANVVVYENDSIIVYQKNPNGN